MVPRNQMFGSEHGPANTSCSPSGGGGELCDLVEEKGADEGRSGISYTGITAELLEPVVNMQFGV